MAATVAAKRHPDDAALVAASKEAKRKLTMAQLQAAYHVAHAELRLEKAKQVAASDAGRALSGLIPRLEGQKQTYYNAAEKKRRAVDTKRLREPNVTSSSIPSKSRADDYTFGVSSTSYTGTSGRGPSRGKDM